MSERFLQCGKNHYPAETDHDLLTSSNDAADQATFFGQPSGPAPWSSSDPHLPITGTFRGQHSDWGYAVTSSMGLDQIH